MGCLFLKEFLIYELGERYKIIIEVSDSVKQFRIFQIQVMVNVNDIYNNLFQIIVDFLFNSVDVEILENVKLGVFVVYIMVFDFDMGYNG